MRRVRRAPLPAAEAGALAALQAQVDGAADPKAAAKAHWHAKPAPTFAVVRCTLEGMANGRVRCMYCEDSAGTDIEHFRPKSTYPAQAFVWGNYLLACSFCNSNLKRTQFPLDATGAPLLLDPSDPAVDPADHLQLIPSNGRYADLSAKGRESIVVFDLNATRRPERLAEGRRHALLKLQLLILDYDRSLRNADTAGANDARACILDEPFPAVRDQLVRIAATPAGPHLLRPGVPEAIVKHGIAAW